MTPTKTLVSRVQFLASKNYVGFKHLIRTQKSWLHNYPVKIRNQYHGGQSLTKLHGECDLALVECGKDGPIYAVLPIEMLLDIMSQAEPKASEAETECQNI